MISECELLSTHHLEIMENKIPLPDMEWLIKPILRFIQLPRLDALMNWNTVYTRRYVMYFEHNYSCDLCASSNSSLWVLDL